jgi:DNA-binding transcriptional regulator YiaG
LTISIIADILTDKSGLPVNGVSALCGEEYAMSPEEIYALREDLDMSQAEFAKCMQVSFATVNRWENNKAEPTEEQEAYLRGLKEGWEKAKNKQGGLSPEKYIENIKKMGIVGTVIAGVAAGIISPIIPFGFAIAGILGLGSSKMLLNVFKEKTTGKTKNK